MALPSQARSTAQGPRFSSSRSRRRKNPGEKIVLALIVGVPALILVWVAWPSSSPSPAHATGPAALALEEPEPGATQQTTLPASQPRTTQQRTIAATPERPTPQSTPATTPIPEPTLRLEGDTDEAAAATNTTPTPAPATTTRNAEPIPDIPLETRASPASSGDVNALLLIAESARDSGRLVDSRLALNRALHHRGATPQEQAALRARLTELNNEMFFGRAVVPGDPLVETYRIGSGDSLSKVVQMHDLDVDWRLVQRVNGLSDPRRIRVGQQLKLVRGPFHAVVDKSDYRMDIYANFRDTDGNRLFIRSFDVGLGEYSSTPVGMFRVRANSKLVNPDWTNPRTGEHFSGDDPKNPIGERWIGLDGVDEATRDYMGLGIHGTIEPQSIGTDASMGCIRLLHDDVEIVYELLASDACQVEIVP